ncbi:MAG: hypothetical protein U0414_19800 [Polyangiaceae bacterium]
MRWKLVALAVLIAAWFAPQRAFAFHAGQTFSDPPGSGGGGGIFYLGTPKERGWDCGMCHRDAPKRIRLRLQSDPPELFERFEFQPGLRYAITATMEIDGGAEELGAASPGNANAMSATFEDDDGAASGLATGVADDWTITNGATLTYKGTKTGARVFTFNWFAPDAATAKPTTFWLGLVDGNGGAATDVFQDPLGDDVFMTHVRFAPAAGAPAGTGMSGGPWSPPNLVHEPPTARAPEREAGASAPLASLPIGAAGAIFVLGFLQTRKKRRI